MVNFLIMTATSITKAMAVNDSSQSTLAVITQFISNSWPMIITMGGVWKVISEVAKFINNKQEAKLRLLIQSTVKPDMDKLSESIEGLIKSNEALTKSINEIKYNGK